MADVTLLQQEIILLKLRIVKLESDKKNLQSEVAVLIVERQQADTANVSLSEKLKNTEKVCQAKEWSCLMMENKYLKALEKIEQLKNELINVLGNEAETSDDDEDTPSATSIQEDN
jgi:ribosome-binding protein aMBF1 (putative translation factor)